ncbi:beta subunit of N-acylethanolamine-hydrolyzing acid amidase-domain-containing protein [Mycena metata]|uniref:ceramidase n=1 Tax=Mycena metata TaxID=1033252 RepID=A0AAD7K3D3_9AGAR|nr:beta subunit of N-acylethanolamine-hydrolyzing acid amidase-domain-containing protein [Mycena metata]
MAPTTRSQVKAPPTPQRRLGSPNDPPTYRVDLDAPPETRYREICADFSGYLKDIVPIYDDLLSLTPAPRVLHFLAKSLLRRVRSAEETREIKGISKLTGVPLHLVVAYNTFLDLLSGCSSGGARVTDAGNGRENGIIHFRGLDWGMDALRRLLICVDYVRDGHVVARAVTYAGYIGVLTGVRKGLSLSLNYRVRIDSPSSVQSHRLHQAALLLGIRPSIPSILRKMLLSPSPPPSLESIAQDLPRKPSTPCYLVFCTPASVLVLEKDLVSAEAQTSNAFLAVTNHDLKREKLSPDGWRTMLEEQRQFDPLIGDSIERKECVSKIWAKNGARLKVAEVADQLQVQPVQNESTHFSCIMDPAVDGGGLLWVRAYDEPVEMVDVSDLGSNYSSS